MRAKHRELSVIGLFILALLVAYGASLNNPFFILDDGLLVFENNILREISLENLRIIFTHFDPELYIPLTIFSYQMDYLIGGYNPLIYHITNLLLHTANSLLAAWFAFLLLKDKKAALISGLLFAVHPINTEAVAWVSGRKDLLSAFFFFLTLVLYEKKNRGATVAYVLGLLSKVSILTLPFILLLIDFYKKRRITTKTLLEKTPYFALSIIFGVVALVGKQEEFSPLTMFQKLLLAFKSTVFYAYKIILPFNFSVFYPQMHPISAIRPEFAIPVLAIAVIFVVLWYIRKKSRGVVFGALFFAVMLSPSFISVTKGGNIFFASDRYAYAASFGAFLALVLLVRGSFWGKFSVLRIKSVRKSPANYECVAGMRALFVAALVMIPLTMAQSSAWGDQTALLRRSTELYPEFYLPYISLGASERMAGNYDEAEAAFRKALSLNEMPNLYALIGQVYAEQGRYNDAIGEFEKGIALSHDDPELHYGLGQVYALQKKFESAKSEYEKALEFYPKEEHEYKKLARRIASRRDMVYYRLGLLYGERGMHKEAIENFRKAIEENPYFADSHYNLAVGLGSIGDYAGAIRHYKKAEELDPNHKKARANLNALSGWHDLRS